MQVASALPEPADAREPLRRRVLGPIAFGLAAASLTALGIGAPIYRTTAVIAAPGTDPLGRVAIVRSAVAGVVSKPVIRRAARSLSGTGGEVPASRWWTRLSGGGSAGKGAPGEADLAQALAGSVVAAPGVTPGTIEITAASPIAEDASSKASAIADAFVAEQDESALQARRQDEAAITSRIEILQTAAIAAHRHLTDLGGNATAGALTARPTAAAQMQAAVGRRDAIKAILAAGSPPLGDGKGVPATIDSLQTIYLEQMRQLAHARETLGERHTTVIALTEAVERAAAKLTTEWRRLKVSADAEVNAAQDREDALQKADAPTNVARLTAIAGARSAAERADAALLRAEAAAADTVPDNPFRVIGRAPVPVTPSGLSAALRAILTVLSGALASGAWRKATRVRSRAPRRAEASDGEAAAQAADDGVLEPMSRPEPPLRVEPEVSLAPHDPATTLASEALKHAAVRAAEPQFFPPGAREPEAPRLETTTAAPPTERTVDMPNHSSDARPQVDEVLKQALTKILPSLAQVEPLYGTLPTVMIAANEIGVGTTAAALALGHVAVEAGYRVLIIEGARSRADLAAAVDPKAEPVLVDMFGGLRVTLKAERCEGSLFLAPCFREGPRIASALARGGETSFIDEVADAFDLIVIDGGRAADAAAEDWGADIAFRVARFASTRDDDRFVATLALKSEALLGTLTGSTFLPKTLAPIVADPAPTAAASDVGRSFVMPRPLVHQPLRPRQARPQAPRSTMRRRVGLR